jgi:hypothetical protein
MEIVFIFIALVLITGGLLFFIWKTKNSRKLTAAATSRIRALLERSEHVSDPTMRILEYDKILDQLMLELGFKGSTGEKLMKAGPRFSNKDALWRYHKLRNIVAHEHGAGASASDADNFRNAVMKAFSQVSRRG